MQHTKHLNPRCKILKTNSAEYLEELINKAFDEGFTLDGEVKFLTDRRGNITYFQMMTKERT